MLTHENIKGIYPLSPMQEGMFFHYLFDKTSTAYFEQISFHIHGELDFFYFEKSLNELFKRYDILRTVFTQKAEKKLFQIVLKERAIDFFYDDIGNSHGDKKRKDFIEEFKLKDRKRYFNLQQDVLMRVSLLKTGPREYEIIWSFHHIIMDGWCLSILIAEFFEIYDSYLEGTSIRLPLVRQYREYIDWLAGQDKEESLGYWKKFLAGYEELASLAVMSSAKRPAAGYRNEDTVLELDSEKTGRIKSIVGKNNVTVNTVIQAIWGILLGRYSGREDVVYGAVVSGRPSEIEGIESMVGIFINTIPVRIKYNGSMKFKDLLGLIQESAIEGERCHYCSLADIQAESLLKHNLLDHIMVFENYPLVEQIEGMGDIGKKPGKVAGLKLENAESFEHTNYNFNIIVSPLRELIIIFKYNANLYSEGLIKKISGHFERLIDQIIADEEMRIKDISFVSEKEKKRVLYEFNDTKADYPEDKTIHELFAEQVLRSGDNIALVYEDRELTYKELDNRSNLLARVLREKGILPHSIIGVMIKPSFAVIIGIMGILKAGGAYLPIETAYPGERKRVLIKNANISILLTKIKRHYLYIHGQKTL